VGAAVQGATPGTNGFDPALEPFAYDPDAARRLLQEAGYGDGFPLTIYIVEGAGAGVDLAFQKVAQDLARIGVRAEVRSQPIGEYTRRYVGAVWTETEAFSMLWNGTPFNDTARPLETFSCLRPKPFFCDTVAADLLAASAREMDPTKRTAALQAVMRRMRDQAPAIWLTSSAVITAMTKKVHGYVLRPAGSALEKITLDP
jgi:ABC-type transport system substrate-binding protein